MQFCELANAEDRPEAFTSDPTGLTPVNDGLNRIKDAIYGNTRADRMTTTRLDGKDFEESNNDQRCPICAFSKCMLLDGVRTLRRLAKRYARMQRQARKWGLLADGSYAPNVLVLHQS